MQLMLNTYGTYLTKSGDCFEIKAGDTKKAVSSKKVQSIWIATAASFSTDAIELAMENNIDVVFLDRFGQPYARVWQSKLGSTTKIRRRQLEISESPEGVKIALEWVVLKIENQLKFLNELLRHRPEKRNETQQYLETLEKALGQFPRVKTDIDIKKDLIRHTEGGAGRAYFACLGVLLPKTWETKGRSHRPARDPFNAMLNYAYGILYSMTERACLLAGLDPYIGFLHSDNYNKKSLVFDVIEPFRIIADKSVFYLFSKRKVKKDFFSAIPKGISIHEEGKKILVSAFNENMDQRIRYRGRNIAQRDIIQYECHRLANRLLGKNKK